MKNGLRVTAVLLLVCMVFGASVGVLATNLPDLRERQQQQTGRMATARDALAEARRQGNTLTAEILELDVEIEDLTEKYDIAYEQLQDTIALLAQTRIDLAEAEVLLELQYEAFREGVRFMHERGTTGYLEILFRSRSFTDIIRNIEYINRIVEHDNRVIDELEETERRIAQAIVDLTNLEAEQAALEEQLRIQLAELEALAAEKYTHLQQVRHDERRGEQLIRELEAESERIGELIRQAEAAEEARRRAAAQQAQPRGNVDTSHLHGTFHWPVQGRTHISSQFGNRPRPIGRGTEFHTGIDIPAPIGTPILAAESGTVILSGWHGGFGNTVIISHGNGVSTLYAHNSRNSVSVGQTVRRGQQIALAGSTGHSTGPHLHFEVRIDGRAVNPNVYFNR